VEDQKPSDPKIAGPLTNMIRWENFTKYQTYRFSFSPANSLKRNKIKHKNINQECT